MNHLAVIPARGGSKRLVKKNLRLLGGKPLVQHTLEAVAQSGVFKTIILSSDDDDILAVAENVEGVIPEKRPANLSQDTTKVLELIVQIAEREGYEKQYDSLAFFLPTCPFRNAHHIREAYQLLTEGVDSVVSITKMEDPVQLSVGLDEETKFINPEAILSPSPLITGNTRSQDFVPYYRPNGGFYISRIENIRTQKNFFKGKVKGYYMDRLHSVDVDTEMDLNYAQFLIDQGAFQTEKVPSTL